mgnify:CR=1 FL=1
MKIGLSYFKERGFRQSTLKKFEVGYSFEQRDAFTKKALEDGYTFYSMTAERSTKPAVQELFAKLASDEVQHQAFLKSVAKNYDEQGVGAFQVAGRVPEARAFFWASSWISGTRS